MKKLMIALCVLLTNSVSAQDQFYNGILDNNLIKLDPESNVERGGVNYPEIKLFTIPSNNIGYAEFSMEPTTDVDVGLSQYNANGVTYGFQLGLQTFNIIVDGLDYSGTINDDEYNMNTTFRVEKCGENIYFLKDGVVFYTHCSSGGTVGELHQRTVVNSSNDALLDLIFEENSAGCNSNFTFDDSGTENRNSPVSIINFENVIDGGSGFLPNTYYAIKIKDDKGRYIRQFKKRSNSKGKLLGCDEIVDFLQKNRFIAELNVID